jgi:hypothetical protein
LVWGHENSTTIYKTISAFISTVTRITDTGTLKRQRNDEVRSEISRLCVGVEEVVAVLCFYVWTALPLKMGTIGYPETSLNNYKHTLLTTQEGKDPRYEALRKHLTSANMKAVVFCFSEYINETQDC